MLWLILIGLAIFIFMMMGSSNDQANLQKVHALAEILSSESVFRDFWRLAHRKLAGAELPQITEDEITAQFFGKYLELVNMLRAVNKGNHKMMGPVLEKRGDMLEDEIARHIGGSFQAAWSTRSKALKQQMDNEFQQHLGVKL